MKRSYKEFKQRTDPVEITSLDRLDIKPWQPYYCDECVSYVNTAFGNYWQLKEIALHLVDFAEYRHNHWSFKIPRLYCDSHSFVKERTHDSKNRILGGAMFKQMVADKRHSLIKLI